MITRYTLSLQKELLKPTSVSADFFQSGNTGFSLDYFYGPYDTPENGGLLQFTYEDEDENIVTRPNIDLDGPSGEDGVWHLEEGVPVYNTRLDYQKALAKQMLIDVKQFFVGKKVAFITDDGKSKEYVVTPDPESVTGELHFEDADLLDLYTVNFMTTNGSGAQAPVQTVSKFYSLPKSEFIAPNEVYNGKIVGQLFEGWSFGYTDRNNEHILGDDVYAVGQTVNLADLCESAGVSGKEVTFYAQYMTHTDVLVNFENGHYTSDGTFVSLDGGDDMSGYIQIQSSLNQNNQKPADWDTAYSSYFTKTVVVTDNAYRYIKVDWRAVWNNESYHDFMHSDYEWTSTHFAEWFPGGVWNIDPTMAENLAKTNETPILVYTKNGDETDTWNMKSLARKRDWYAIMPSLGITYTYSKCGPDYLNYENMDLYTHIVRDSMAVFNNGSLVGDVQYDCKDSTNLKAFHKGQVQLDTEINSVYADRFEFEKWEIEPKTAIGTQWIDIPGAESESTSRNLSMVLDTMYTPTGYEDSIPASGYVFRAVYRKRSDYYSRIKPESNSSQAHGSVSGHVDIYCKLRDNRGIIRPYDSLGVIGRLNQDGTLSTTGVLSQNVFSVSQSGDKFELDSKALVSIKLVPVSGEIGTTLYCWTSSDGSRHSSSEIEFNPLPGADYGYKAWFADNSNLNAVVRVNKRKSTPTGGSLATEYNGSTVGIYGWMYQDDRTGTTTGSSEHPEMMPGMEHLYEQHVSVTELGTVVHMRPVGNFESSQPGWNNNIASSDTAAHTGDNYTKVINENDYIGTEAVLPLENGTTNWCCLKATEAEPNGARFVSWSDGNTENPRLVSVDMPVTYQYTAVFMGEPLSMSGITPEQEEANMFIAYDLNVSGNNGGNAHFGTRYATLETERDMMTVTKPNSYEVFVTVNQIGIGGDPKLNAEYSSLNDFVKSASVEETVVGTSVVYDYNGNEYREETIINGFELTTE